MDQTFKALDLMQSGNSRDLSAAFMRSLKQAEGSRELD
jgi:hypothetical protein